MDLGGVLSEVSDEMLRQFRVHTAQFKHRGLKGATRERIVQDFLEKYLPQNIELVSGEVFDVNGVHSPECDILAIDRNKTPLLFDSEKRLVPVEGVFSVLEVKSYLDSAQLNDSLSKCKKVKSMAKGAYFYPNGPVVNFFPIHNKEYKYFPTLFTVFCFDAINPRALIEQVENLCKTQPIELWIDSIVCVEHGWMICWWNVDKDQYDLVPSVGAMPTIIRSEGQTLALFYCMYYRWLSQVWCHPIDIAKYISLSGNREYPTAGDTGPFLKVVDKAD